MYKIKTTFLLFALTCLLLPSCSEEQDLPENLSTLDEESTYDRSIQEIQNTFKELGVFYDLNRLSLIVTDNLNSPELSECFNFEFIVLDKQLFVQAKNENKYEISSLWLHVSKEIGHCYLLKTSYEKLIKAPSFKKFRFTHKRTAGGRAQCSYSYAKVFNATLMSDLARSESLPTSLKRYFLAELAGLTDDAGNYKDLLSYGTGIVLVNNNTLENSNWFRCN